MSLFHAPGVSQPAPMTREQLLGHVAPKPAWERHHRAPLSVDQLLNVRPGGVDRMRQVDPNWSVDLLAFTPGATAGTNAAKIGTTLAGQQTQPLVSGSGGMVLEPVAAGFAPAQGVVGAVDIAAGGLLDPTVKQRALAGEVALEAATGQGATTIAPRDQRLMMASSGAAPAYGFRSDAPRDQRLMMASQAPAEAPLDQRLMMGPLAELAVNSAAASRDISPDPNVDATLNVSGGGPGTSTAKGHRNIASQRARRREAAQAAARRAMAGRAAADAAAATAGNGFLSALDSFISQPGQSAGVLAENGVRRAAAGLHSSMPRTARMLRGLAPAARWAAPAGLFAATTVLPAAMGAMEGNEKAGAGGAVLQGGSALAGAAIGQALIPIPVVGAGIGAMVGNAVGGGLTSGAQALAEESQKGTGGLIGGLGAALDPFIDTSFEREQKAVQQQMNSPAVRAIQQQEALRREQARTEQVQALYLQSLMR